MNILILGMPNVGKTSLYNLITIKNNNIIHDTIGTTRDWHVSPLKSNSNIKYQCIKSMAELELNIDNSKSIKKLILE